MFTRAITGEYKETSEIVALCDVNAGRMELKNRRIVEAGAPAAATYAPEHFERMISETKPDAVIVTTVDATHDVYILRAMRAGCDVITEKPMTTDERKCRQILHTVDQTRRRCQVTFNYRYSPPRSQVREMIASGAIGEVFSVDFAWMLDTRHGADYFRRWHRRRVNSGSLLVHKATHHFDLVNWWIDDMPEEVFCQGSRRYYVPDTAKRLGLTDRSHRCLDCPSKEACPFYLDLAGHEGLRAMYLDNEAEDGYFRDRCVFSEEIDIWDTMSVCVRYARGAVLNYLLHAYCPMEGYRIAFNGSEGRLEHRCNENSYVSGDGTVPGELEKGNVSTTLVPEFAAPQEVEVRTASGGHGGGDTPLLADIFADDPPADPLRRKANQHDGAMSILVGVAAYRSIDANRPIRIPDLLDGAPLGRRW
jgi:predicted dehydrogenase